MPGLAAGRWSFELAPGGECRWRDAPSTGGRALVEAALSGISELPFLDIDIDTRSFFDPHSGKKLGLGSSAAAMTALVGVLCSLSQCPAPALTVAARAHAHLQGGYGSGVDIASSYHGGVIEFRKDAFQVRDRRWPPGLHYKVLWSGKPADTVKRIASLHERVTAASDWDRLRQAADRSAADWRKGDAAMILRSLHDFSMALRAFSDAGDLHVFAAGHDELAGLAEKRELVYKPSGAGGGDIGMVFGLDKDVIDNFCRDAARRGFATLPFALDEHGLQISPGKPLA